MTVPCRRGRRGCRRWRGRRRWSRRGSCWPRRRSRRAGRRGRRSSGRSRPPGCSYALGSGGRHLIVGSVTLSSASHEADEEHYRRKGGHPPQSRIDGSADLISTTSHEHAETPACSICSTPEAPRMGTACHFRPALLAQPAWATSRTVHQPPLTVLTKRPVSHHLFAAAAPAPWLPLSTVPPCRPAGRSHFMLDDLGSKLMGHSRRTSGPSRSFVLAALRTLHLSDTCGPGAVRAQRPLTGRASHR
jgi:hypothetical protein